MNAKYGELSYEDDNLRTVEMTIKYDFAHCDYTKTPEPTLVATYENDFEP